MVDTRKQMLQGRNSEARGLVPKDWQLIRKDPAGKTEILAEGVLAFDVGPSGNVLYTDGKQIHLRNPAGEVRNLGTDHLVERVVLLL
jgi:hypothetical protein